MTDDLLTATQVMERWGLTRVALDMAVHRRRLVPALRTPAGNRYRAEDVRRYVAGRPTRAGRR